MLAHEQPDLPVSARDLLESVPDAVIGVDRAGTIMCANGCAEAMFGYGRNEMVGQPIEMLVPETHRGAHVRHRTDYHANPTTRPMGAGRDLLACRKDGTEFPVEISLSPLRTNEGLIISVVRDVTARREVERERVRLQGMKDDLANMVVHDLKNPVNGIVMTVQLLMRKGELSEMQRNSLLRVDRTCRELLRLVGNVLEIAKIEAGQMPVTTELVVLAELVDELAAHYGPVADEVGRRLEVAIGTDLPPAIADRRLLKRVLENLIANALRHSGSMEVRVEAAPEPAAQRIAIRVIDHGHGIADADQSAIFDKYRTSHDDPTADTGLGLPFCKLAVERMDGYIMLSSARGRGTTFTVSLPHAGP